MNFYYLIEIIDRIFCFLYRKVRFLPNSRMKYAHTKAGIETDGVVLENIKTFFTKIVIFQIVKFV